MYHVETWIEPDGYCTDCSSHPTRVKAVNAVRDLKQWDKQRRARYRQHLNSATVRNLLSKARRYEIVRCVNADCEECGTLAPIR